MSQSHGSSDKISLSLETFFDETRILPDCSSESIFSWSRTSSDLMRSSSAFSLACFWTPNGSRTIFDISNLLEWSLSFWARYDFQTLPARISWFFSSLKGINFSLHLWWIWEAFLVAASSFCSFREYCSSLSLVVTVIATMCFDTSLIEEVVLAVFRTLNLNVLVFLLSKIWQARRLSEIWCLIVYIHWDKAAELWRSCNWGGSPET